MSSEPKELPLTRFRYGFLGPAIILLAFGQATGELIQWPYLFVKYKAYFLFLLIPACFIQFPLFSFLARHTIVSGESFFSVLLKARKTWAAFIGLVFLLTSIWIASYTAAGGVAVVKLWNSLTGSSLDLAFWSGVVALVVNTILFVILLTRRATYKLVKVTMDVIAALSFISVFILFAWAISVKGWDYLFFRSLLDWKLELPADWDPADTKIVISAFVFAGLGGLWNILYSGWMRSEKMGMAQFNDDEFLEYRESWQEVAATPKSLTNFRSNMRLIHSDLWTGIGLNFLMLLMLGYIAYALFPTDQHPPSGMGIVTVLADSIAFSGITWIAVVFYAFLGLFLMDTWLTAADSLSKVFTNLLIGLSGAKARENSRTWYVSGLVFMWAMTALTTFIAQPQQLIFLNGVLSALGSVLLVLGISMNESKLRSVYPWLPRAPIAAVFLAVAFVVYILTALAYLLA